MINFTKIIKKNNIQKRLLQNINHNKIYWYKISLYLAVGEENKSKPQQQHNYSSTRKKNDTIYDNLW